MQVTKVHTSQFQSRNVPNIVWEPRLRPDTLGQLTTIHRDTLTGFKGWEEGKRKEGRSRKTREWKGKWEERKEGKEEKGKEGRKEREGVTPQCFLKVGAYEMKTNLYSYKHSTSTLVTSGFISRKEYFIIRQYLFSLFPFDFRLSTSHFWS